MKKCFVLLTLFLSFVCSIAAAEDWMTGIPSADANGNKNLNGEWAFAWQIKVTPEEIIQQKISAETVELPAYLDDLVPANSEDGRFRNGVASYFKRINNINNNLQQPVVKAVGILDAWKAYWISSDGVVTFLGGAGDLSITDKRQNYYEYPVLLEFPEDASDGVILFHISTNNIMRTGLYSELNITELEAARKETVNYIIGRAFLFGIGIYVIAQNLSFFFQRRKEFSQILLTIMCSSVLVRLAFSSGYINYLIGDINWLPIIIKLEYILVVCPGLTALNYLFYLFPFRGSKTATRAVYLFLILLSIITLSAPAPSVSYYLWIYQLLLVLSIALCLVVIIRGIALKMPGAMNFLVSSLPVIVVIFHDLWSVVSAHYSILLAEYALFFFFFAQTQRHTLRFISALDLAEHLTENLQVEVDLKTKELSTRNAELQRSTEQLKTKHKEIKHLAETDHLTGLYNRQTLEKQGKLLLSVANTLNTPLSIIMMDIDHFKSINDEFGHIEGDECLIFTSSYLQGLNFRKSDVIARYGGEEFTLILPDTTLESATKIANNVCQGLPTTPVQGNQTNIYLTASFGVAELAHSNAASITELIDYADKALYKAKENGRNRVEVYRSPVN